MASRRLFIALAGSLLLAALVVPSTGSPAATGSSIRFGTPTVVDPVHTFGEPDIRIAPDGSVYDSGPWGTGTQRSLWEQSTDGGRTFHVLHDTAVSSPEQSDSQIAGPGGGDTEISIDHTNKVYYADLAALVQLKVATWDKKTHTMSVDVLHQPDQSVNGIDRQWFGLWDPPSPPAGYTGPLPVNYLVFAAATTGASCIPVGGSCELAQYSTDGTNYSDITTQLPIGSDGPAVVDQQTGDVLEAIGVGDSNHVGIGVYERGADPNDPSLVKATPHLAATLPGGASVGALFPVIAEDTARNAYLVWVTRNDATTVKQDPTQWQIYYSYATAATGWTNWSTPVQISHSPSNTNIMPWVTAGSDGRVAAVWYGTNDSTHNPSTEDAHQKWNVYVANITDAASSNPTIVQQRVTRHPMHYGSICLGGTGCAAQNPPGNRNLADFFEDSVDPRTGALVITYDDTANELKQHDPTGSQAPPEQAAHRGAPVVMMIRQTGGIGMFGTPLHGARSVATRLADQKGDASFDPVYSSKNIAQLDLRKESVRKKGKNLVFRLSVKSLGALDKAFSATNASAIDYVFRWTGAPAKGETGTYNPLYYAAAEITQGGAPSFFAGLARSVELCSVSGCFPHILEYPEPPYAGTSVTGKLKLIKGPKPDQFLITVPLNVVGKPRIGKLLEDFGAYVFARNKPASVPMTNSEAEGGITPIMVDGVCCVELKLKK